VFDQIGSTLSSSLPAVVTTALQPVLGSVANLFDPLTYSILIQVYSSVLESPGYSTQSSLHQRYLEVYHPNDDNSCHQRHHYYC
jgi:hypothetical protein